MFHGRGHGVSRNTETGNRASLSQDDKLTRFRRDHLKKLRAAMISPERLFGLQGQWVRLLGLSGVPVADAYPPFDRLVAAYSEPHRAYHNLEHLGEMFRVVSRLAGGISNLTAVQFAVWYHDAVYNPKATDNEIRSAEWADKDLARWGVSESTRSVVRDLILSTTHLETPPATPDTAAFLDADLAILGAAEFRYERYANGIRKEFEWVPEPQYREGRRKVLEGFLARARIFHTDMMHQEGEESARRNLQAEMAQLSG